MPFVIKTRGARGPMVAEYLCPLHGRFEATVDRDEHGDPPATLKCPAVDTTLGWEVEYSHAQAPALPPEMPCPIDDAEHVISAARLKFPFFKGAVFRGNGRPEEQPSPTYMDTEPLADGMPAWEFAEKRKKVWEDWREAKIRKELG
jgi:hypothetical protein